MKPLDFDDKMWRVIRQDVCGILDADAATLFGCRRKDIWKVVTEYPDLFGPDMCIRLSDKERIVMAKQVGIRPKDTMLFFVGHGAIYCAPYIETKRAQTIYRTLVEHFTITGIAELTARLAEATKGV